MMKGIGPISSVELGEIDPALVSRGEEIFKLKCSACHKLEERYVAPPLGDVLERRTPEFVMNMMLNSMEMTQRHPAVKELLAEYFVPMPNQDLTEADARAVLEYIRNGGGN
jgi:cytochrome c2